ncbi:hypothetical protein [Nonomuraea sp. NPDC049695]|uniref:hypothetical protein n=1 Tax=Nonomuraea sp. NPDC049695 TaxID=3154734 RepID=UPI00342DA425
MNRTRGRRLRVYVGAAPGVGKTYAMLGEGRRGRDVVVDGGEAGLTVLADALPGEPHRRSHLSAVISCHQFDRLTVTTNVVTARCRVQVRSPDPSKTLSIAHTGVAVDLKR